MLDRQTVFLGYGFANALVTRTVLNKFKLQQINIFKKEQIFTIKQYKSNEIKEIYIVL